MAMAVEITFRTAARRYYYRAREFQALLSPDYRPTGILVAVAAALVVVPEVIPFLKRTNNLDLYESMVFWFFKEFIKAILGLGLILGIIVFLRWINSED